MRRTTDSDSIRTGSRTMERLSLVVIALVIAISVRPSWADEGEAAKSAVAGLQGRLIEVMKNAAGKTVPERYEMLTPAIREYFHFPIIARLAVGEYWSAATADQRERLATGVFRLTVATLATFIDGYEDQFFKVRGVTDGPAENVLIVDTMLIQPESDNHRLSYLVANRGERWGVIDAIIDGGISELNVRRSEYSRVLEEGGVEALISALNAKADELLQP